MEYYIAIFENLNIKNIKTKEKYKIILESCFNEFYFLNFNDNKIKQLILKTLKECIKINNDERVFIEIFNSKIKSNLKQYTRFIIKKDEDENSFINNFINQNIIKSDNKLANFKQIRKFINLFNLVNYELTIDYFISLINSNEILNSIIKEIVTNNITLIENGEIEKITIDADFQTLIEAYCACNNIEINEQKEQKNTEYLNDSISIYFNYMDYKLPVLTKEEEKVLFLKYEAGDLKARDEIIKHNLKLVVSIAKKYINRGIEFEDLIQDGNEGLIKALDKFDVEKGFKFSTYATWWIKQSILRGIQNNSRTIRMPVHMQEQLDSFNKKVDELTSKYGRRLSYEEYAEELNISVEEVKKNFNNLNTYAVSLDSPLHDDEDSSNLVDFIRAEDDVEEETISKYLNENLLRFFKQSKLTNKEIQIIVYRYGLNDGNGLTLEEIGRKFGVSRERIRQIERRAFRKLKTNKEFIRYFGKEDEYTFAKYDNSINNRSQISKKTERKKIDEPIEKMYVMEINIPKKVTYNNHITLDDYYKAVDLSKSSDFKELLKYFKHYELIVIILKYGLVDEKFFMDNIICEMTGVSQQELLDIKNRALQYINIKKDTNRKIK